MTRLSIAAVLCLCLVLVSGSTVEKLKKRVQALSSEDESLAESQSSMQVSVAAKGNACKRTDDLHHFAHHYDPFRYTCPNVDDAECASNWAQVSSTATACANSGRPDSSQSPIDLQDWDTARVTRTANRPRLEFYYTAFSLGHAQTSLWNDGSTLELCAPPAPLPPARGRAPEAPPAGFIVVEDTRGRRIKYNFERMHFHTPSEHSIGGVKADAELHLVHMMAPYQPYVTETADTLRGQGVRAAVVFGFMLYRGPENPTIKKLINANGPTMTPPPSSSLLRTHHGTDHGSDHISFQRGTIATTTVNINPGEELLAKTSKKRWYNYKGSLTTPDCLEIVDWWVNADPLTISQAQLDKLRESLPEGDTEDFYGVQVKHNNRPVQINPQPVTAIVYA